MGAVLYLHGRGDSPASSPGDLVRAAPWSAMLFAPSLGARWTAEPFDEQVDAVDAWLDAARLAVGHSYGAWLLLCATEQRITRGASIPRLLLLSCPLGTGGSGRVAFIAPRSRAVRCALGLSTSASRPAMPADRLSFVHAVADERCPVEAVRKLDGRFRVDLVPGGHRLDHPVARETVWSCLHRLRQTLAV